MTRRTRRLFVGWAKRSVPTSHQPPATSHQPPAASRQEPGARSQEPGARSQEPGARSQEPGARSQEPGARGSNRDDAKDAKGLKAPFGQRGLGGFDPKRLRSTRARRPVRAPLSRRAGNARGRVTRHRRAVIGQRRRCWVAVGNPTYSWRRGAGRHPGTTVPLSTLRNPFASFASSRFDLLADGPRWARCALPTLRSLHTLRVIAVHFPVDRSAQTLNHRNKSIQIS
ncbi:hypothetical protein EBL85_02565 [Marichromatium sp. AB32]|nr:hypothetical protein EBL85_02565 [Marichromatium sp. AB32]